MRGNHLSGVVTSRAGGTVAGLTVEAWPLQAFEGPLASAVVTEGGGFELAFADEALAERRLQFRFFSGLELLASVEHEVNGGTVRFELPRAPAVAPPGPIHAVRGRVRAADGSPIVGARVRAFDKELRKENLLGEVTTDAAGRYEIRYTARFESLRKRTADVIVRVYRGEEAVAESPLKFNAPASLRIDFDLKPGLHPGISAYEQIDAALAPLLGADATAVLGDAEVEFLAGKTGLAADAIRDFDRAGRLAEEAGISNAAAFALVRHGLPYDLTGLLAGTKADHEAALATGLAEGVVPADVAEEAAAVVARLGKLRTSHPLRKAEGEVTLGALLGAGGVQKGVQETFLRLVAAHTGPASHLWRKLRNHPDGGNRATDDLIFALQAAALARGNAKLLEHLHDLRKKRTIDSLRDLAGLEPADWRARLDDLGASDDAEWKDALSRWLSVTLEAGFPTAALAQRLAREPGQEKLPAVKFLNDHPDFDLGTDRSRDVPPNAVAELERLQRLFRIAPRHAELRALEKAGFDSAFAVASAGHDGFVRAVGGAVGTQAAERIFGAASRVALRSFARFADTSPALNDPPIAAIPRPPEAAGAPPASTGPSVLGQGAYFADLLAFLRDRRLGDGKSALDVLFASRRADLGTLPLGGAAADARVARIDLVIELLEHAIAGAADRAHAAEIAAGTLAAATFPLVLPFDRARAQARVFLDHLGVPRHEIMATFQKRDRSAPTDLEISLEELGLLGAEVDLVTGGYRATAPARLATRAAVALRGLPVIDAIGLVAGDRVLVKHQPNPDDDGVYVASSRNWARAADAPYLAGLIVEVEDGVSRGHWVLGPEGFARLKEPGEADALPRQPWEYWGFPDDGEITAKNWPAPLADLGTLLARTGLTREDLIEILDVPWVNPPDGEPVAVDPSKPIVHHLTAAAARRIIRFARLRRRLGWTAHELGRAVAVLAPHEITDRSLLTLAELRRLSAETQLPVATLLPLYGNLDVPGYTALVGDKESLALVGGEPKTAGKPISSYAVSIAAVLGITGEELSYLVDPAAAQRLGIEDAPVPDEISIPNLTRLYRRVTLAKAAGLTIGELLVLHQLSGVSPFDGDHIDETRRFLALAAKLRAAGTTVGELDDLLRGAGPADPSISAAVAEIRAGLQGVPAEEAEGFVIGKLAGLLAVEPETARALADALHSPRRALDSLTEGDEHAVPIVRKIRRGAALVAKLKLAPELAWFVKHGSELGWLDLDSLPEGPSSAADATARFAAWERLVDYVAVRDSLFGGGTALTVILQMALDADADVVEPARSNYFAALGERTGWSSADVDALAGGLGLSFPKDFRDARTLGRIEKCLSLVRRTGVPAARLVAWRGSTFSLAEADDVVAAVRAKTDPAAWPGVAGPLHAAVRAARRDALVGYLLHARAAAGAKVLSDHFLVDVQTADTAETSRLEQAIASVRLFIQRCFLGLEPAVILAEDDARRWRWLADFRTWSDTRRALLYPESQPGGGETSASLAALERDLAAGVTVEEAMRSYLERLDASARLEIAGLFVDRRGDALHLVGRGAGVYFYRARSGASWSPWEPIAGVIDGEPVLPIAWADRVLITWPIVEGGQVKLAWTERQRAGWTARRTGADGLRTTAHPGELQLRSSVGEGGAPVVTVLTATGGSGTAPRAGLPTLATAASRRAQVVGRFRFTARGPIVIDEGGAEETLPAPRRSPGQLRLSRDEGDLLVLRKTPPRVRLAVPHQSGVDGPVVFDDGERTYLVGYVGADEIPWSEGTRWTPGLVEATLRQPLAEGGPRPSGGRLVPEPTAGRYVFERLDHPLAGELLRRFGRGGAHAIFGAGAAPGVPFETAYDPVAAVVEGERVHAPGTGPQAAANRELGVDVPFLVAGRLLAEHRHEEAQRWLHHIFDPSATGPLAWKLPAGSASAGVDGWLRAPLDPRQAARARATVTPRTVVLLYLANLLAWGDQLLADGAAEAAALLFRLAAKILGPRPRPPATPEAEAPTIDKLLAAGGNPLVAVENALPHEPAPGDGSRAAAPGDGLEAVLALGRMIDRFAVPSNAALVGIWDAVETRLEKVQ